MDTMAQLTWLGTIASIVGAGISFWQSVRARSAADEAVRVKTQLVDHREASELTQLQTSCKKAQKSMEKYGPGSTPASLVGISHEKDAADLQEFIICFGELRGHFGQGSPNQADIFCKALTPLLDDFAQSNSNIEMRQKGKVIVIQLSTIAAAIKRQLDVKRETLR